MNNACDSSAKPAMRGFLSDDDDTKDEIKLDGFVFKYIFLSIINLLFLLVLFTFLLF